VQEFPFRFERAYRLAALPFGVTPHNAMITLSDSRLRVRFGPWHVSTRLENITKVSITGPYAVIKTAGPARLTLSDRGLTFATNRERGVFLEFAAPIPGIAPTGRLRHPNLTVTAADCDALARALRQRGD
jgi:hypothetical protein